MFLCGPMPGQERFRGNDPQDPNAYGYPSTGPPPPGFKPDYTESSSGYGNYTGSQGTSNEYGFRNEFTQPHHTGRRSNVGGFWSGMGTGGVLGYLFGSQRRQPTMSTGNSGFSWKSGTMKAPVSTGTRTASGFGGTKRR
ncbi:hypothetical protein MATL_G00197150 [Megalops atlanticus]|uniref:Store-operated calcium entry-associated regulatory factor n=1 Tax=Megalops atlanticus TaxID=7932 RepID=A0A9D3PKC3_MEGAT|nr:hypothetical protein MATL_G00197150 [Megalops atlanticus]